MLLTSGYGDEKVLSKTDGTDAVDEAEREKIRKAVCLIS